MTSIGIVGAGAAAAAAAYRLDDLRPDATITVLEKSGGVCGRAATRRRDGVRYDYGANYLKDDDEPVTELVTDVLDDEGLVDATDPVWTFDADGRVSEGRDADDHKWSYAAGLTQLAKRLFGRTDATVHRETRIERIRRDDSQWRLHDASGDEWGPFDVLVLNPPAPQTADLLEAAEWEDPARSDLAAAARSVDYRTIYTAVLHYPFRLDRPYYALVNVDKDHEIGWVSREECKPGHVPAGESVLIVQANQEWSVAHYDEPAADNVTALAGMTAGLVGDDRLAEPDWTDHQDWRYALPENGVETGPLRRAEAADLYAVGDWIPGEARLHAAVRDGLETGDRIADAV
ncbi:MAG: NAD(P)/FAD-dependent oxidoreductase [Salinirussus sp.]